MDFAPGEPLGDEGKGKNCGDSPSQGRGTAADTGPRVRGNFQSIGARKSKRPETSGPPDLVAFLLWLEHAYHPGKRMVRVSAHQSYCPDDKQQNQGADHRVFGNALTVLP